MADDADPPRKFYDLKPRDFERVNPPSSDAAPPAPAPATNPSSSSPAGRIDVRELARLATPEGPLLARPSSATPENEVQGILRENHAHAEAAGLNELAPKPRRKSRRLRDYILLLLVVDGFLAVYAVAAFRMHNVIGFVYAMAGIGSITAAATWVMWFVMDDY